MNRSMRVSMWAVAALIAGCGGGGGSAGSAPTPPPPPPPPPPGTFNVGAAWRNFLTTNASWTVSGTASDGKTYGITLTVAPGNSAVFPVNGLIYSTSGVTVLSGVPGLATDQTVTTNYYDPATYKLAGTQAKFNAGAPVCSVVTATAVPPESAAIGASGPLQTFDDLQGCVGTSPKSGTSTQSWSLETDTATGINYFCLNTVAKDLTGAVLETDGDCFQVSESGALGTAARITVVRGSFSLTAKN